jgi:uncharacterized protein YndB with AHSA1/START domain
MSAFRTQAEILLERTFAAPRELVLEMWCKPEHLEHWWGPKGFTLPRCEIDARTGGAFVFTMRGPDGTDYPSTTTFEEVTPPERIVFLADVHDGVQAHTTVTFAETDGRTTVRVHQRYNNVSRATQGAFEGWQ